MVALTSASNFPSSNQHAEMSHDDNQGRNSFPCYPT